MNNYKLVFLTTIACLSVFLLDINLKLGAAVPVLYTGVIWMISLYPNRHFLLLATILSSFFTIFGLWISPIGVASNSMILLNRGLGIFVIWLTYGFLYQRRSYEAFMQISNSLLEKTSNAAFVCNKNNQLVWCNESFRQIADIEKKDKNELKDFNIISFFFRIGVKDKLVVDNKIITKDSLISEDFILNNEYYRIELEFHKNIYENNSMIFGFIIDISETKKYQEELINYLNYINSIINSIPNPLAVISADLKIEIYNQAFGELFSSYVVNTEFDFFNFLDKYDLKESISRIENFNLTFISSEVDFNDREYVFYCSKLDFKDGNRYFLNIIDVSDYKKAIVDVQNVNNELKQFASIASHDLQEPLRKISSFLQILDEDYGDTLPEDAKECIDFAVSGANRLKVLIDDLLDFTSLTRTQSAKFEKVITTDSVANVIKSIDDLVKESKAEVNIGKLLNIYANSIQFEQVIQNLLTNAIKYKDKKTTPKIFITSESKGGYVKFIISDNGIGIEKQYAEKVFMIFKRLHSKEEFPGTGVGLAMCKRIVEAHGGRIWFESELGKGTDFYFTMKKA